LDAGILTQDDLADEEDREWVCMTGKQFRESVNGIVSHFDEVAQCSRDSVGNLRCFKEKISKKLKVLARSSPEDKYLLVTGLKQLNSVVAVTGDGTNDAPALNKADVGFAMGIAGTDVAKNASDIVLTDDNFCSVLTAVKYGRNIFDNVRKFLQFQLTVNIVAMFIVFSGALIFNDAPLTSVQMLWVNLIMDTFAALALATEKPSEGLLDRKPVGRNEKIVNNVMWRNIIGHAIYQIAVLITLLFFGKDLFDLPYDEDTPFYVDQAYINANPELTVAIGDPTNKTYVYTIIFQAFVFMQLFNLINAKKLGEKEYNIFSGLFNNCFFLFILVISFAIQVAMIEYGGRPLRAVRLNATQNWICVAIGAFTLVWGVIIKVIMPASCFNRLADSAMKETEMTDQEEKATFTSSLRKSFRQSTLRRIENTASQSKLL